MNIERFKSALSSGGVRPSFFRVQGPIGKTTLPDKVGFLITASTLPASTLGEISVNYRGRALKLPGNRTYADWGITVLSDGNFELRNAFERWSNDLNSAVGNVADQEHNWNNVLFPQWSIDQLDRKGNAIKTYTMFHCWPKEISSMDTAYDNEGLASFTVTMSYAYWLTNDGSGSDRVPLGNAAFPGE